MWIEWKKLLKPEGFDVSTGFNGLPNSENFQQ